MTGLPVSVGELVGVDYLNEVARAHWRNTTLIDLVSSTTETDLIGTAGTGISIPANTLGTQRKLRITTIYDVMNNGVTNPTLTFKLYYGGTNVGIWSPTIANFGAANHLAGFNILELVAQGATNSQRVGGFIAPATGNVPGFQTFTGGGPSAQAIITNTVTVDSTLAQNLRVTATWSASSANLEARFYDSIVEAV